jgi:uncharacterized membrane protein YozB (DUF420 family)
VDLEEAEFQDKGFLEVLQIILVAHMELAVASVAVAVLVLAAALRVQV